MLLHSAAAYLTSACFSRTDSTADAAPLEISRPRVDRHGLVDVVRARELLQENAPQKRSPTAAGRGRGGANASNSAQESWTSTSRSRIVEEASRSFLD